jgi:hypothetical protein
MKFLINGMLEGQPFEMEIEGEDRRDAIAELNHSVICLDGKPLTKFPKFDLRTLRKAPESDIEAEARS